MIVTARTTVKRTRAIVRCVSPAAVPSPWWKTALRRPATGCVAPPGQALCAKAQIIAHAFATTSLGIPVFPGDCRSKPRRSTYC